VNTRKGGGFYGYKIDMAVCTTTDLPLAWNVRTARDNESVHALPLLDTTTARGFAVETAARDKGYDIGPIYDGCEDRDVHPIIPASPDHRSRSRRPKPPTCERGDWRFAGSDSKRGASSWRCPTGECQPASVWIKASRLHPLMPRETPRFIALHRRRAAVERDDSRTNGRSPRYVSVDWTGFGCTPT
jgi:hypothetical protein